MGRWRNVWRAHKVGSRRPAFGCHLRLHGRKLTTEHRFRQPAFGCHLRLHGWKLTTEHRFRRPAAAFGRWRHRLYPLPRLPSSGLRPGLVNARRPPSATTAMHPGHPARFQNACGARRFRGETVQKQLRRCVARRTRNRLTENDDGRPHRNSNRGAAADAPRARARAFTIASRRSASPPAGPSARARGRAGPPA